MTVEKLIELLKKRPAMADVWIVVDPTYKPITGIYEGRDGNIYVEHDEEAQ